MNITQLELWTHNLAQQRDFYAGLLQLAVIKETAAALHIKVGTTRLIWTQAPQSWQGCYHFAFNIPANQFAEATEWLKQRVSLLSDDEGNYMFHSQGWNADNIYFYDPAGNIGELIARHTLDNAAAQPFSAQSLLEISEIGIASNNVPATVAQLRAQCGLAVYQASSDTFAPVGDEHGLFIVVKHERIWFPDTGKPAVFVPIIVHTQNDQAYTVTVMDDQVRIES